MICTNCSSEVPDSAVVCGHCGHRLRDTATRVGTAPRSPRRWPWVVFGIVGLLAAAAAGILALAASQSEGGDATTTAVVALTTSAPATSSVPTTASSAPTTTTRAATTTAPTAAPLPTVPWVNNRTFDEAFDEAAAAGFTLVEGASIPFTSRDPRIGVVVRTEPPAYSPHDPTENLWAEMGYDGGIWVKIPPVDPAQCDELGGNPLPADVELPLGLDHVDCPVLFALDANAPFFVKESWSQSTWPDEETSYIRYTLDGEEPAGYRTIERLDDRFSSEWYFSHPGLPPGNHDLIAEWWIDSELALRLRVAIHAG